MTTHERQEYAAQLKREMNCCHKGIGTGKILCSCENCVRNAVFAAEEALETK